MNGLPKDRDALFSLAQLAGWSVDKTNGGHIRVRNPKNGCVVITPSTPSDYRGTLNFRSDLKKAGLRPPAEKQNTSLPDTTEYFTMPEKTPEKRAKQVLPTIVEVLGKYARPLDPREFWPQVAAKLPEGYSYEKFIKAMYNAKDRGVLRLVGR